MMKTATIPAVRVEPQLRAELESVLIEGETMSDFVEAAVKEGVERRRAQAEFMARGLASRDGARSTGAYVAADVVVEKLERRLATARTQIAAKRK